MTDLLRIQEHLKRNKGAWKHIATQCGVSYRAVWNIAHNRTDPRSSTLTKIARYLDVPQVASSCNFLRP